MDAIQAQSESGVVHRPTETADFAMIIGLLMGIAGYLVGMYVAVAVSGVLAYLHQL